MASRAEYRANFRATVDATPEDWERVDRAEADWRARHGPAEGLLALLASIAPWEPVGVSVNLFTHCLQTATRVLNAGGDDELVVVALFHDVPEAISDNDHGMLAAELLAPWITERRRWLLIHHAAFQNHYFSNHPTRDRNARDQYARHPCYAETDDFCRLYDQNSFDPDFPTLPLATFMPIVRRFLALPAPASR
ncbi:MAG: phosphohydrolase [Gammaproteobacteria bacterium]|nr:phosphohydrolase [Gammaproteobacteria bacterium]